VRKCLTLGILGVLRPMNLQELYQELKSFDWGYERSDDTRVYMAGVKRWEELKNLACSVQGGVELVADFYKWAYNNGQLPELS
jgi:hypothetical protein